MVYNLVTNGKNTESKFVQRANRYSMTVVCRAKHGTRQVCVLIADCLITPRNEWRTACSFLKSRFVPAARCIVTRRLIEKESEVMRFSGPRLLFKIAAVVRHFRMMLRTDSARVAAYEKEETSGS